MADQVKLFATVRRETGKNAARRLRREGRVPAVVYGADVETTSLHVDALDLYHALHTEAGGNVIVQLEVDGEQHLTIPREVQRHPVRGDLLHVDFFALERERLVRVEVPIHLEGVDDVSSPGVISQVLHQVPIRVRPLDIPPSFALDVSELMIGEVLRVADIPLPPGAELDIEPDRTVATCTAPSLVEVEEEERPEEAAAQPPLAAPLGALPEEGLPVGSRAQEPEETGQGGP